MIKLGKTLSSGLEIDVSSPDDEMLKLAKEAVESSKENVDIKRWAKKLAKDICQEDMPEDKTYLATGNKMETDTRKVGMISDLAALEEAALREKLAVLAQKHAKAVAELDETEEENIKLIGALRDIRRTVKEVSDDSVVDSLQFVKVSDVIMKIVDNHIK